MPGPADINTISNAPRIRHEQMHGWMERGGGEGGKPSALPKNCISLKHCVV